MKIIIKLIMYNKNIIAKEPTLFSLDLVKNYLRIDHDMDNEIIEIYINLAEEYAEKENKIILSRKTIEISTTLKDSYNAFIIEEKPIINILEIRDKNKKLISEENYKLENNLIIFHNIIPENIYVKVDCGCEDFEQIDSDIKIAILNHILYTYENRGNQNNSFIPKSTEEIYRRKRIFKL